MPCPVCPCQDCAQARRVPFAPFAPFLPITLPAIPPPTPMPGYWQCSCGQQHPYGYTCVSFGKIGG
jgi:hypothetical protein